MLSSLIAAGGCGQVDVEAAAAAKPVKLLPFETIASFSLTMKPAAKYSIK